MDNNGQPSADRFIPASCLDGEGKSVDPGTRALLAAESAYIKQWRSKAGRPDGGQGQPRHLTGLALSGGGIRSAMFSLGIMQALARRGLLVQFDYLSTVSGGGYIGSALSWLTSQKARRRAIKDSTYTDESCPDFDCSAAGFPFGSSDPADLQDPGDSPEQHAMMQFLRKHGDYLNPGAGISIVSLVGVILRGLLLNLLVWMPVFVLINLLGLHLADLFKDWLPLVLLPQIMAVPADAVLHGYEFLLWLAILLSVSALFGISWYSLMTRFKRGQRRPARLIWYRLRRASERTLAIILPAILIFSVVGILPALDQLMRDWWFSTGPGAILAGIGMAIVRFVQSLDKKQATSMDKWLPLIAVLLIYGTTLVTFRITYHYVWPLFLQPQTETAYWLTVGGLALFSAVLGWVVNLNYIAIHRYYRDRLMETFMPDLDTALQNRTSAATDADGGYLCSLSQPQDPTSPYHIINTNVVLVGSEQPRYRLRGGDNFILSPQYCGSNATGWQATHHYMRGQMTLPTAVAISGAAANPNAGVGGQGITRNKPLSLVMSFLNVRLGYWAQNPAREYHIPNHFFPGLYDFLSVLGFGGYREDRNFVQLSDGGHFENTGIYELIRRRLGLIVACDGGADPEFSFSDLQTTVRRVEDDFGARITIHPDYSPDSMIPRNDENAFYPEERAFSERGFMLCTIHYRDGSEGTLVYLKTALTRDVSFKVKGYAAQNPEFPDQTTADQFFDEVQIEAYRELGYRIATSMILEAKLAELLKPSRRTNRSKTGTVTKPG